ncbi:AraC family transcriptional regulator [Paenibacillus sp.]|uniref:helix-turn-helix domain-containing protein n=1 Tax=Paenibacillus sp. TaxID=58172 RepID=UPI002836FAB6|nr:AraC family transcriptional regulator [Paenibacillus sp.]MDR0270472.1 AraC family transcriptional regulator [Paenibacillus sp.]
MKRFFTNLGIVQIFGSLLLVIGIMYISNYFVYKNSISGVYDKVAQNNNLAVKTTIQSFDDSFRSINNIIHSIHGLPYNSLESEEDGRIDMVKVYTMQDSIATLVSSVDFIEEVIVFYDDYDLAITSLGTSSLKDLFQNKYKHDLYNESYWRTYTKGENTFKMLPGQYFKVATNSSWQRKKLMVAIGGNKIRISNKNIIILIDEAALLKHVNQKLMIPGGSLIVLDQDRSVILSTDSSTNLSGVLDEVYFNSSQEASLKKEDYQYNFYKSDLNDFVYINKVPYQFQNINSVIKANEMIMISAIICAILLSVLLSIYLNRPVKKIIHQLGGGSSRGNDFRKILSGVVKMQMELDKAKQQLKNAESEARRSVFLQAVDEYVFDPQHGLQPSYSDLVRGKYFVLMMVHLDLKDKEQAPMPVEVIAAVLDTALRKDHNDVQVFYDKSMHFVALIGMGQPKDRAILLKGLKGLFAGLEQESLSAYSVWASVSELYAAELKNYKLAYRSAMNGLLYRAVNETSHVLDAEKIHYGWSMYFPFDKIEKLSNYLSNGKLHEGKEIISETLQKNASRNVHQHQMAHIAKTMFLYILRNVNPTANQDDEMYKLEQRFLQKIDSAHDYMEIEHALIEAAKHIAKYSKPEETNKLNPGFISQYIELHYMENLYLDHIAEIVETSPKYFSSYFKKTFGINYVEYLNKVRLSHAKELLKDSTLSIGEIGEKTGYLNSSTFTTTFKKYVGISPSEYRKQHANE